MNKNSIPLVLGSFFGFTGVLLGAFGAHYLKTILNQTQLSTFETAVRYQMYHALIICAIGFFYLKEENRILSFASFSFIIGIVIFSGSLYLYVMSNVVLFAIITPIGGLCLILGWFLLLYFAIKFPK